MSRDISITVQDWLPDSVYPEEGELNGEIVIALYGQPISANSDHSGLHDGALVSARRCAFWFLQNWWRLRWEPAPNIGRLPVSWRLAHEMRSIGGGYHWPGLTFSSDGLLTNIWSRLSVPRDTQPMYFAAFDEKKVLADSFERAIDEFILVVLDRAKEQQINVDELSELNGLLKNERDDELVSSKRRREALLGFDPDMAPLSLIGALEGLEENVGGSAADEFAALLPSLYESPTASEANALLVILQNDISHSVCLGDIHASDAIRRNFRSEPGYSSDRPWKRAVAAARWTRAQWDLGKEPLGTEELAAKLHIAPEALHAGQIARAPLGVAVGTANDALRVSLRRTRPEARRFELCRMLGDYLFLNATDYWRPVTAVHTARQQFQRAFSAELLCPIEALQDRLEGSRPVVDIEAWAHEFEVDELVVLNQLKNNNVYLDAL